MGYYYGIYATFVVVTYLLLYKRIHILREKSGKISFWTAALLGLLTPYVFERSQLFTASIVYIVIAAVLALALSGSSMDNLKAADECETQKPKTENRTSSILTERNKKEEKVASSYDREVKQPGETIDQIFDQLLRLKTSYQSNDAVQLAEKVQRTAEFPTHIRQLMTMELADLYMEKLEYTKALDQLQYISILGELSEDVHRYIHLQTQAIETAVKDQQQKNQI